MALFGQTNFQLDVVLQPRNYSRRHCLIAGITTSFQAWAMADSGSSDYTIVKTNQYTGLQQYTVSPRSSVLPEGIQWVSALEYGVFLGRTPDKKILANILARSISRLLLPVHTGYTPSPKNCAIRYLLYRPWGFSIGLYFYHFYQGRL